MKKFLALFLGLFLILSLASCNNSENGDVVVNKETQVIIAYQYGDERIVSLRSNDENYYFEKGYMESLGSGVTCKKLVQYDGYFKVTLTNGKTLKFSNNGFFYIVKG